MPLDQLFEAMRLMMEFPDETQVHGPKPEALIERAEDFLGIRFPPSYRTFLSRYGKVGFCGTQYYGLLHEDDDFSARPVATPNVVLVTDKMRTEDALPVHLVAVCSSGYGPYFVIDTSRPDTNAECPIVEWLPAGQLGDDVAPDFAGFLLQEVRGLIEYMDEDQLAARVSSEDTRDR